MFHDSIVQERGIFPWNAGGRLQQPGPKPEREWQETPHDMKKKKHTHTHAHTHTHV